MKDITKVVQSIVTSLKGASAQVTCDDSVLEGEMNYLAHEGVDFVIAKDHDREEWVTNLKFTDGNDVETALCGVLGLPTMINTDRPDGVRVVNWQVKKVLIVMAGDNLDVIRPFKCV